MEQIRSTSGRLGRSVPEQILVISAEVRLGVQRRDGASGWCAATCETAYREGRLMRMPMGAQDDSKSRLLQRTPEVAQPPIMSSTSLSSGHERSAASTPSEPLIASTVFEVLLTTGTLSVGRDVAIAE